MPDFIQGPRPGDLVMWRATLDVGYETRVTISGTPIPIQMRPPEIELTLCRLSEGEARRAIEVINEMRGGAPVRSVEGLIPMGAKGPPPLTPDEEFLRKIRAGRQTMPPWNDDRLESPRGGTLPVAKPKEPDINDRSTWPVSGDRNEILPVAEPKEPAKPRNRFEGLDLE